MRSYEPLHPQFVTNPMGNRVSALLPIAEYEAILDLLENMEDLEDAYEALGRIERGEEELIPWETVKAECGL